MHYVQINCCFHLNPFSVLYRIMHFKRVWYGGGGIIIIIIIIIIVVFIILVQNIYSYIPETNHVSRVYNVSAIL